MNNEINYLQTFNPIESNSELLEKTLFGRKKIVDVLEESVIESASSGNKLQRLIIGSRGSGKTHLLKVLYNRISNNNKLKDKINIAYLCEDEYGIATFLDLLVRILNSFYKWDFKKSNYLKEEIENLKKTSPNEQEKTAKDILLKHIEGTTVVVIIENIGKIFAGIKDKGQRKLRDFLQQFPFFSIMASNQSLFEEIQKEDKPFHNFFKITHLKKLTLDESIKLLEAIASWEKESNLIKFLDNSEGRGRIQAIYDITGGNHRLLVTFYNFLKTDYKYNLSNSFIKMVNDLIPYYQSFMDLLSEQQQKITQYLCQSRKPSNVKEIAQNCFSSPSTISKQMSNLIKLKYVDGESSGKETYYELSEPLLRICFEVKENRGGPIKLFIDFLGSLYSAKEIKKKYMKYHVLSKNPKKQSSVDFFKEQLIYKETLKQYYPDILKNFEIDEFENAKGKQQIMTYIEELKKSNDYTEILEVTTNIEKKDKDLLIEEAYAYISINNPIKAIEILALLLEKNKNDRMALMLISGAFNLNKEFRKSKKYIKKFLELDPNVSAGWMMLGTIYLDLKNAKEAKDSFLKAIELDNKNTIAIESLGELFLNIEEYQNAFDCFNNLIKLEPDYSYGWKFLGLTQKHLNNTVEAKESFLKAIKLDNKNGSAILSLAGLFYDKKNYEQSCKYFSEFVKLKPDISEGWIYLGISQRYLQNITEAKKSFLKAIELNKNSSTAIQGLGALSFDKKDYRQAYEYFYRFINLEPDFSEAWKLLGLTQEHLNDIDGAEISYIKAIELDKKNVDVIEHLGILYGNKNDYQNAYGYLSKLVKLKPDSSEAWELLGWSQKHLKNIAEAKKSILKAIELDNNNTDAITELIEILAREGNFEAVESYINKLLEKKLEDFSDFNTIGEIYRKNYQFKKALIFYEKALNLDNDDHHPYFNLLSCRIALNDITKALIQLEEGLVKAKKLNISDIMIQNFEENISSLLIHGSKENILQYLNDALVLIKKYGYTEHFFKAIPQSIFEILIQFKEIENMRFEFIESILNEIFKENKSMIIPLKFLNIGIRYLKKNENNVLFQFTKEERNTFKKFVLSEIN